MLLRICCSVMVAAVAAGSTKIAGQYKTTPPPNWPKADWATVPVYMFCGPNARYFNAQELNILAGTAGRGWKPRWIALGYATLAAYPPRNLQCQAKQAAVAAQIKSAAPLLPVLGGTAWDITLCGTTAADRAGSGVSKGPCMMEVDQTMRSSPNASMLLHCGGKLVHRGGDHRTVHGFTNPATRAAWADQIADDYEASTTSTSAALSRAGTTRRATARSSSPTSSPQSRSV